MEVNLLDHILTGPFEFKRNPMWTIADEMWDTLVEKAADMEIEPAKMNCIQVNTIAMDKNRVLDNRQQSAK